MNMKQTIDCLDDEQFEDLSIKVALLFDRVPMTQVRPILDRAEAILLYGHKVDIKNPRFTAIAEGLGESEPSSGQ